MPLNGFVKDRARVRITAGRDVKETVNMPEQLSENDIDRIYSALASETYALGITAAGRLFRAAGLLPSGDQRHWAPLMQGLDQQFRSFTRDEKLRTVRILGGRLIENRPETSDRVKALLRDHGFQFVDGTFLPNNFFDEREARYMPPSALSEISTALSRLATGDLDGALASACSAVETAAADVYRGEWWRCKGRFLPEEGDDSHSIVRKTAIS
jgi:hypothetical protein